MDSSGLVFVEKPKSMVDGVGRARGTFVARVAKVEDSM